VDIDRSWAKNVTNDEFQHEYVRRFPWSDVLPTRESYLASDADRRETLIFPTPEQFEHDTGLESEHVSESEAGHREADMIARGQFFCVDCQHVFENAHGLLVHRGKSHKVSVA